MKRSHSRRRGSYLKPSNIMGDDARRTMWGSAESENDGSEIGGGVAKKESVKVGKGKKVTAHITGATHTADAISDGD